MTSTEIVPAAPSGATLPQMIDYAEKLANSGLLPKQYVRQPANVLYAMEYGRTLGITPIAAITGIHVIEGKPSSSAGLISGLVRRAGHKLRVSGNGHKATARIIRSDDPDALFEVTWELRRNADGNPNAEDAGLLKKDIWNKYPAAMLKARAITQVARDACEEVLFGLHYTAEELGAYVDQDGLPVDAPVQQLHMVEHVEMQRVEADVPEADAPQVNPAAQELADRGAQCQHRGEARPLWPLGKVGHLMEAPVLAPDTDELDQLGLYLTRLLAGLPEAPADGEPVIHDAEIVPDEPVDPLTDAIKALRRTATEVGLTDAELEEGFETAYGTPVVEATLANLLAMTATLRPAA